MKNSEKFKNGKSENTEIYSENSGISGQKSDICDLSIKNKKLNHIKFDNSQNFTHKKIINTNIPKFFHILYNNYQININYFRQDFLFISNNLENLDNSDFPYPLDYPDFPVDADNPDCPRDNQGFQENLAGFLLSPNPITQPHNFQEN